MKIGSSAPQLPTRDKELVERAGRALFEFVFSRTKRFDSKYHWANCDEATKDGFREEAAVVIRAVWPLQLKFLEKRTTSVPRGPS